MIKLRRVTNEDANLLFEWANDHSVRANAFDSNSIDWTNHVSWLSAKLDDLNTLMWIAYKDEDNVGQVRVDYKDGVFVIDYSVAKEFRKQGIGSHILNLLEIELISTLDDAFILVGYVKQENAFSCKIFEALGYQKVTTNGVLKFEKYVSRKVL